MMRHWGTRRKLQQLLKKYSRQTASVKERGFVDWYYQSFDNEPDFLEDMPQEDKLQLRDRMRSGIILDTADGNNMGNNALRTNKSFPVKKIAAWTSSAAAIVIIAFTSRYLFNGLPPKATEIVITHVPAIEKAILTSKDGLVSSTTDQGEGLISSLEKGGVSNKGKFNYVSIEIPMGCKYHFKLEDGTEVWLNPGSKMHIPLDYGKSTRTVSLWGEAYFSVQHKDNIPFHVLTEGLNIKDIGTEFKVSAYLNQKTSVTLAKGSIVVYDSANHKNFSLDDMGEQILLDPVGKTTTLQKVDTAFATSLKNNLFYFDHASINEVIHEVGQWYNVTFKLEGYLEDVFFTGSIRRDSQLQDVLKILELSNINYRMDEGIIILSPGKLARLNGERP